MSSIEHSDSANSVDGVRLAATAAGIKSAGEGAAPLDLLLMEFAAGSSLAAVFTQNAFCAAPVHLARQHLSSLQQAAAAEPVYCLINAGNANAGTGRQGARDALSCCQSVADVMACGAEQVLPFSTGVIGEPLPVARIAEAVPTLQRSLSATAWPEAAAAIMTTDTVAKQFHREIDIDGQHLRLSGICKGAGMIRPNMATMLAYVTTDAAIAPVHLDALLRAAVAKSFNRITVDGDTSTNDACLLVATGQSPLSLSPQHAEWAHFVAELQSLFIEMATAIIRDAEGASKFITLDVRGGRYSEECLQVGYAVAESPLVKTAFFASDANWGRILAAIGRAGVEGLDVDSVTIDLGDVRICEGGGRAASYSEEQGAAAMAAKEIVVTIDLARGDCRERLLTSDLSLDYVHINADYRS